ncbi:hypothetical protein PsYK624_092050 [Phanerochaete sordida]|uniref:Uncharacterized protein n=1 Tax=Phanerochaete sordida TaxID=48140 RepID=A0A9P3GE05_9APHY|nr:hypothetical protein PsYK624_092050 [Phanerochaete sordida]
MRLTRRSLSTTIIDIFDLPCDVPSASISDVLYSDSSACYSTRSCERQRLGRGRTARLIQRYIKCVVLSIAHNIISRSLARVRRCGVPGSSRVAPISMLSFPDKPGHEEVPSVAMAANRHHDLGRHQGSHVHSEGGVLPLSLSPPRTPPSTHRLARRPPAPKCGTCDTLCSSGSPFSGAAVPWQASAQISNVYSTFKHWETSVCVVGFFSALSGLVTWYDLARVELRKEY